MQSPSSFIPGITFNFNLIKDVEQIDFILGSKENMESNLTMNTKDSIPEKIINFSGDEQEVFTLQTFNSLLKEYFHSSKTLIIAKVQAPNNSGDIFDYFYSASELNKTLYKYERERRLLHRMKTRNPLNNMFIHDEVKYFAISPHMVSYCIAKKFYPKMIENFDISDLLTLQNTESDFEIPKSCTDLTQNVKNSDLKKIEFSCLDVCAPFFCTENDFLKYGHVRNFFKKNCLDPDEEFIFDLDRTSNDLFALIDSDENENSVGWRRVLSLHVTLFMSLLFVILLLGVNPIVIVISLPLILAIILSFIGSVTYVMCFRRQSFDSLAVENVDEL